MARAEKGRQEFTGYRVTSKVNGTEYRLGNGKKTRYGTRYDTVVKRPGGRGVKYDLAEGYIREMIKREHH